MLNILCGSSKKPLVHPGLLMLSKLWQIPLDLHPILQQEPGFVGAGSEMASVKVQGWELLWLHPPVAVGAVAVACWAAKSESCEAQCKQPLQLG